MAQDIIYGSLPSEEPQVIPNFDPNSVEMIAERARVAEQFREDPKTWQVSPEEQAERDQQALKIRATEPPEEAVMIGPSLSDVRKTEGKKAHPLDTPSVIYGKAPEEEEPSKVIYGKPRDPLTFSESIGEEPLPGERYIARIGEAASDFGETFMKPHEHPEYGMYKTMAEQIPATIGGLGAIAELVARRVALPGLSIFDKDPIATADKVALLWKKRGEELGTTMAGWLPDYLTSEIKKEAEKPAGKAGAELLTAPVYPLVEAGEAIGESYGEGRAALFEHFMNVGMLAVPGAVKGIKTRAGITNQLLADLRRYAEENRGIDLTQAKADALQGLLGKLDDTLPPDRQKYKAPEGSNLETHLQGMAGGGQHTIVEMLDAIANHSDAPSVNRAVASQLADLYHKLGLDNITADPTIATGAAGRYRPSTDELGVSFKYPRTIVGTTIHEAVHSITLGAIELAKEGAQHNAFLSPTQLVLKEKGKKWIELYKKALDTQAKKDGYTKEAFLDRIEVLREKLNNGTMTSEEAAWYEPRYGFKDPHEFAAEFMVDERFQDLLKNHVIHEHEVPGAKVQTPRERASHFREAREFFNISTDVPGHSIVPIIADHLFDMIGSQDIKTRTRYLDLTSADQTIASKAREAGEKVEGRARDIEEGAERVRNATDTMEKMAIQRLANLVKNSPTLGDFLIRLSEDPFFRGSPDLVAQYAERLYTNDHLIFKMAENSGFKDLPEEVQKFASDPRDIHDFIKEEFTDKGIKEIEVEKDISKWGTYFFNPSTLEVMKAGGPAGKVLKWFHSKAREIDVLKRQVFARGATHLSDWNSLPRKDALKLWDLMQTYNKPLESKRLKDMGQQWIPEDELRAKGMNDAQINAYKGITKMLDYTYDLVNQTRLRSGQPKLDKIPAYIPNIHEGAFKVFVRLSEPSTVPGYPSTRIVSVRGFNTQRQAKKFADDLELGKYDRPTAGITMRAESHVDPVTNQKNPWRVARQDTIESPLSSAFSEYYDAYQNLLTLDPKTLQMIEHMESQAMRGMVKAELERSSVSGYRGEFGQSKVPISRFLEATGIGSPLNQRMLQTFETSMKQASEHYGNGIFVSEVVEPLLNMGNMLMDGKISYGQVVQKLTKLKEYLREYGYNFTGESLTKGFTQIDKMSDFITRKLGVDPNIIKNLSRDVRNLLSIVALRGNPRNYVANASQLFHTLEMLEFANSEFAKAGIKTQPAAKSFSDGLRATDKEMLEAVQWAKDMGFIEAQLEPALHTGKGIPFKEGVEKWTGREINPAIERFSRENVFKIAYEHFRKTFPDNPGLARDLASKQMRNVMVDYNRAERPLMYTNTGILGEMISPFAVFRNAWFGNTALMVMKAIKEKNLNAIKPLITSQLVFLSTAGALGVIGAQDYNDFVGMVNRFVPEWGLSRLEEVLMSSGEVPLVGSILSSNAFIYGAPSAVTGIQFGSSQQAVGMSDMLSVPMLDFMVSIGSTGIDAVKWAGSEIPGTGMNPPTKDEIWKDFKAVVPSILRPELELMLKGNLDISPQAKSLVGTAERTTKDKAIYMLTGAESLDVTREKQALAINAQKEQAHKKELKTLVNVLADQQQGMPTTTLTAEEIERRWSQISDKPITELGRLVTQEMIDRNTSQKSRISGTISNETFKQMKRLESMQSQ